MTQCAGNENSLRALPQVGMCVCKSARQKSALSSKSRDSVDVLADAEWTQHPQCDEFSRSVALNQK